MRRQSYGKLEACPTCGVPAAEQCVGVLSGYKIGRVHASRAAQAPLTEIRQKPMSEILVEKPEVAAEVVLAFLSRL
jgi:hypothetical protein